jgi:hypothetical protein
MLLYGIRGSATWNTTRVCSTVSTTVVSDTLLYWCDNTRKVRAPNADRPLGAPHM